MIQMMKKVRSLGCFEFFPGALEAPRGRGLWHLDILLLEREMYYGAGNRTDHGTVHDQLWEQASLQDWIKSGHRVIPISVNVSSVDIYAIDVVEHFKNLVCKDRRLPPEA